MIINNTPENEAVLSNVGEVGEFRIKNSAKAFGILSSSLYANKIRAIIRELSCNAVDSHVAASKASTPFDVHLPNNLEPHFSIRDYGTGLTHDQVTHIYTTYFESSKEQSNDFIGALGLGSKSPFAYTDNFTITAVKDGRKGIYTAFINGQGVPSIALMMENETTDPNGVEVKFSVNDRNDFNRFAQEAQYVYTYFTLRPVISGVVNFSITDLKYESKDIIPGVSILKDGRSSIAIMGSIPYPINVPNSDTSLGGLAESLNCGLEMRFEIGEIDFQPSREGLSYIPQTIDAIKSKLIALNAQLAIHIAEEAGKIENTWERAHYLFNKARVKMWAPAVGKYIQDTKLDLITGNTSAGSYLKAKDFKILTETLATDYNISISGFYKSAGMITCSEIKANKEHDPKDPNKITTCWNITAHLSSQFVITDTKVGANARARNHWRKQYNSTSSVYILDKADKNKPMDTEAFFKFLSNPPVKNIMKASELIEKERKATVGMGKDITIRALQKRNRNYRDTEMVWRDAGNVDSFDKIKTHYYLPLSGFTVINDGITVSDPKQFITDVRNAGINLNDVTIYGVRKSDLAAIKSQSNWINIQTHLREVFGKITATECYKFAAKELDLKHSFKYYNSIVSMVSADSVYARFMHKVKDAPEYGFSGDSFKRLSRAYGMKVFYESVRDELVEEKKLVQQTYRLLGDLHLYDPSAVAEYINLIDANLKKGK